jgi:hypothetical protein
MEAQILVRGSWYGLATAGSLRSLGCQLVGTDVYEGDELLPLSDRRTWRFSPAPFAGLAYDPPSCDIIGHLAAELLSPGGRLASEPGSTAWRGTPLGRSGSPRSAA